MTALTDWCLRIAARRWPADVRPDMLAQWHAELVWLAQQGRHAERLRFAVSLACASPDLDDDLPHGWRDDRPGSDAVLRPAAALLLIGTAVVAFGTLAPVGLLLEQMSGTSFGDPGQPLPTGAVDAVLMTVFCLVAGRALGRRLPMAATRSGRFGPAGPAAYAAVPVAVAFVLGSLTSLTAPSLTALAIAALGWTAATATLAIAVARRAGGTRRGRALALAACGAPATAVAAVLPAVWVASLATPGTGQVLSSVGWFLIPLVPLGALVVAYGWAAARHRPPVDAAAAAADGHTATPARAATPAPVLAAGVALLTAAVTFWAYAVAVLTPAMPAVSARAPMPGGDGEIHVWVAELRWAAIVLAGLALLTATAHRRRAGYGAGALTGMLVVADSALGRTDPDLRLPLVVGALAVGVSWLLTGHPGPATPAGTRRLRLRLGTAAVAGAACAPVLFAQGTPEVNHAFLPVGLPAGTVAVAAGFAVLAAVAALAARCDRLPRPAAVALLVAPTVALAGLGIYLGNGVDSTVPVFAVLLTVPLAMTMIGVLRDRNRHAGMWWTATALSALATPPVIFVAAVLLMPVPSALFVLAGTGYPADGVSVLPAIALIAVPVGAVVAHAVMSPPGQPATADDPLVDLAGRPAPA
ncbi:hypothetical protein O7608_20930 [Solwaraspora sp. WMMA2056]|uniref:hypothetical protein n=1 Tax=Solwaraspora sp. WMMA2056 TaxID=3015161 RepID=UPI00259B6379|nr:hypothetical protein [Solwaraspora sp. WMMA2056]WJK38950.1 hypothetical protein O7608_20930 [Solwaraspora sp. WMMA2056]